MTNNKHHFADAGPYSNIKNKNVHLRTFFSLGPHDVLCGRGNGVNNRQGNVVFRRHVDRLRATYAEAKRQDKIGVARQIVQLVHEKGGKFLKFKGDVNEEVYIEIGLERAVEKACQALREGCAKRKNYGRTDRPESSRQEVATNAPATTPLQKNKKHPTGGKAAGGTKRKTPPKTKRVDTDTKKAKTSGSFSHLWKIGDNDKNGQFSDPPSDAELPGLDGSTEEESDTISESGESYYSANRENPSVLQQQPTGCSLQPSTAKPSVLQQQSTGFSLQPITAKPKQEQRPPPTHRLMMQQPVPTNENKQMEPSGSSWFCDFMNGGSSDASSPSYQSCWEKLFRSLVRYSEVHGHCAIPPSAGSPHAGSSKEEREHARLADWASVQRQIYREIHSGRREATDEEKNRLRRLEQLNFVWNYEEWHWDRRYEELVTFQQKEEDAKKRNEIDFSKCLGLALWVKEQRQLFLEGMQGKIAGMRPDRVRRLEALGYFSFLPKDTQQRSEGTPATGCGTDIAASSASSLANPAMVSPSPSKTSPHSKNLDTVTPSGKSEKEAETMSARSDSLETNAAPVNTSQ